MADSDPVVKRIPVYVNRGELGDIDFNVFQYMTRPFYRPYGDQGELEGVSRRNIQKTFKMRYALAKNENFDEEHVVDIQELHDMEGCHEVKNILASRNVSLPPSPKMFGHVSDRKRVMNNPNTLSNYSAALAVLRDGQLFVTPKLNIHQFRPDLAAAAPQDADKPEQTIEEQIKAKSKAAGGSGASERQALSNYTLWALQEEEPWVDIEDRYASDSMQAASLLRKLTKIPMTTGDDPEEAVVPFSTNTVAYLKNLTTVNLDDEQADSSKVDISLGSLAELPPAEQVKMVIRNLCVAPFDTIKSKLPKDFKDEALLDELLSICVVIQGNFVERSELVIEDLLKDIEPPAQINRDDFMAYCSTVRDLLLSIFADSVNGEPRTVTPAQVIKIPAFAPFRASGAVGAVFKKSLELIFTNISTLHERSFRLKCEPDHKIMNIDKMATAAEEVKKNTNTIVKETLPARLKKLAPKK